MIPLKEAINIFEQRKISLMRDNNHHIFDVFHLNLEGRFSSYDYIICKIKEWLEFEGKEFPQYIPPQMGKSLLDYVSIFYLGGKDYFGSTEGLFLYGSSTEGLFLYGKGVRYGDYNEIVEIDHKYIRTKRHFYIDKSSKYIPCIETKVGYLEDQDYLIFENYNYDEIYNPTINYTVQGNKESNIIKFIDISVDENELKTFLESDVFNEKLPEYVILINNAIDKYLDKVNKVFKETIDKKLAKNIEYVPYLDHFDYSDEFPKIPITKTFDEYLDKHIERQEEYNRSL